MTIKDIQNAVLKLSSDQLCAFRMWFYKFDNHIWDKQFVKDVEKGKLDKLSKELAK